MRTRLLAAALAAALSPSIVSAASFTYRGELSDQGAPAEGLYDLRLSLFADPAGRIPLAAPQTLSGVRVEGGRFAAGVAFPELAPGVERAWLKIEVRGEGEGAWIPLPGLAEVQPKAQICPESWALLGNASTNAAVNFLGTTDHQPLVLRTRNARSLRIEPSSELFGGDPITVNWIAGSHANAVSAGVRGATISGGGVPSGDSDPDYSDEAPNRVTDHYGTVGGGYGNRVGNDDANPGNTPFATVGGGASNTASAGWSTVGGGASNTGSGQASTVAGGAGNHASADWSTVGGGFQNTASGPSSTVGGGALNTASGSRSTVGGGESNDASGHSSIVGGGQANAASGGWSSVGGGATNTASGRESTVPGGLDNCAGGLRSFAAGTSAKVRPGSDSGAAGWGCNGVPSSGDGNGDEGTFVWADSGSSSFVSTGPNQFLVRASGGMAINTNDPAGSTLRVNGTVRVDTLGTANTSATLCRNLSNQIAPCASSLRYKEGVEDLDLGLEAARALRAVSFRWKGSGERDVGFVAEEVARIDERLVTRDEGGAIQGVKYERLSALLARAVQTLADQGEAQAAEVAELRKDNVALRGEVHRLDVENVALRGRLMALEERHARELAQLQARQESELSALRAELSLLRELVAPATASGGR